MDSALLQDAYRYAKSSFRVVVYADSIKDNHGG